MSANLADDKIEVPEPEPISALVNRLKLIGIYVLYFILIGLPMWFYTTSIYQSKLPIEDIHNLESSIDLHFDIPVYIKLPSSLSQDLIVEAQQLVDQELDSTGVKLSEYHLTLIYKDPHSEIDEQEYEVILESSDQGNAIYFSPYGRWVKLFYTANIVDEHMVPDFIKRVIVDELFHEEIVQRANSYHQTNNLALPYSPHYNLVISLVVEGGNPLDWEISDAIDESLISFINQLSSFTNFTIDTQIQYYCQTDLELVEEENGLRVLSLKDLSTFVDYGSWNLVDLISLEPTINFLIYIPKSEMNIENSKTNSFIIPQWGSVKIYNTDSTYLHKQELLPILEIFSSQLLTLLGFPRKPKSLHMRLDMIKRSTLSQNLSKTFDNLNSLIKLVHQLLDIPIPEATLNDVKESLSYLSLLNSDSLNTDTKLAISNAAVQSSNDAFFQKDMIQQNYFPQAHKFTIYLPIVGPVFLILLNSFLRSVIDYKRRQRHAKLHDSK